MAFLQQQWLRERALILRYTYLACLFYTTNRIPIKFRILTHFILVFNLNPFLSTADNPVMQH